MATISNIIVKISAQTKGLKKSLDKGIKRVAAFVKKVGKTVAVISGLITAAFATAFAAVTSSINETAAAIDALAKTADKLGVGVGALQELQYAAELSGVSVEKLNMGLQRMVRRVSEAARGTGVAQDALKELGIDAKELVKLSPDQQFRKISEAMKGIKNQTDRVRLAFKLFDSEGVALVNTLNQDLAKTSEEFRKLGGTITRQQAAAAEAYQDSILKLRTLWQGFLNQITVQSAPAFTRLVDFIKDMIIQMGGLQGVARSVSKVMIGVVNGMINGFATFANTIDRIIIGLNRIKQVYAELRNIVEVTNVALLAYRKITGELPRSFEQKIEAESAIASAQQRIASRNELAAKATQQGERAKLDITVRSTKDSQVEDIKTNQAVQAIIRDIVSSEVNTQARINDR